MRIVIDGVSIDNVSVTDASSVGRVSLENEKDACLPNEIFTMRMIDNIKRATRMSAKITIPYDFIRLLCMRKISYFLIREL